MKHILRFFVIAICLLTLTVQPALAAQATTTEIRILFLPTGTPGELSATVTGLPENVARVTYMVWCETADSRIYTAARQEDGSWQTLISSADHCFRAGDYTLIAWADGKDGTRTSLGTAHTQLQYTGGILSAEPADDQESRIALCLQEAQLPPGALVMFRVFRPENPAAVRVYFASLNPDGTYTGTMIPARHEASGMYRIEAWVGTSPIAAAQIELTGCTSCTLEAEMTDRSAGTFMVDAGAQAPSGIVRLTAAIWSQPDQSDLVWYDMEETGGTWHAQGSIAAHGHHSGTYNIHIYADLGNGLRVLAGGAQYEFTPSRYIYADHSGNAQYTVTMLETNLMPGTVVYLPTWSEENGQDDIYWYSAAVEEDGTVRCPLDLSLHSAVSPIFQTHLYSGNELLGAVRYDVNNVACIPSAELQINRACRKVYDEVGRDLRSVYLWTVENITYVPREWREYAPAGYTREQWFALEGFNTHQGDCFVYSAAFAALARGLGYDARYVEGYVWSVRGLWADHGFVVIRQDGADYVCDPELQSVSSKPRNLFMQPVSQTSAKYKW